MTSINDIDAHEQPSEDMRAKWKAWSKMENKELKANEHQFDDPRKAPEEAGFRQNGVISKEQRRQAFTSMDPKFADEATEDVPLLYHPLLPGLLIAPSLVPPNVQTDILNKMLHRDLSNPKHTTNMHLHYKLPYPSGETVSEKSFFSLSPDSGDTYFTPKEPTVHKKLTPKQVLQKRLHWVTLGGQYDWTNREYPDEESPRFPPDLSQLLAAMFPETEAQAAIVNFYSPNDSMMMHRDVSEFTNKGLVSLSFGCDALFMIAPSGSGPKVVEGKEHLLLRLRSGDAIYMSQASRFAWHGVPKVMSGTCPEYLERWPAADGEFEQWDGWMSSKRINLNVRQMRD